MAYQIGRSERITETLELVGAGGDVVKRIPVSIDADGIALEFNRCMNSITAAEKQVDAMKKLTGGGDPAALTPEAAADFNSAVEAYGNALVAMLVLVFGHEGAAGILDFYENRYFEMSTEVFPFILDVVCPAIRRSVEQQKQRLANHYKHSRSAKLELGRQVRRKMGL